MKNVLKQVEEELCVAKEKYPCMASAHEGYAILLEEVDELWEEVKKRPESRDVEAMRKEAIQVAAMAVRFVRDCCRPLDVWKPLICVECYEETGGDYNSTLLPEQPEVLCYECCTL
jgi:hypothetical protein